VLGRLTTGVLAECWTGSSALLDREIR